MTIPTSLSGGEAARIGPGGDTVMLVDGATFWLSDCCRALKLEAMPSLSMHMRTDVVRRHDDGVLAAMTVRRLITRTARLAGAVGHRAMVSFSRRMFASGLLGLTGAYRMRADTPAVKCPPRRPDR